MKRKAIITIVTEGPNEDMDVAVQCDFDPPVDSADVPVVADIVAVAVAAIEGYMGGPANSKVVNPEESI